MGSAVRHDPVREWKRFQTDIDDAATELAARYRTVAYGHRQLSGAARPARNAGSRAGRWPLPGCRYVSVGVDWVEHAGFSLEFRRTHLGGMYSSSTRVPTNDTNPCALEVSSTNSTLSGSAA